MENPVCYAVVPPPPGVVPAVNRLAAAVRQAGGGVFWVKMTHDDACLGDWSIAFEMLTPERRLKRIGAFTPGHFGHALWSGLQVLPQDLVVRKYRFGAFVQGSSDLHALLQARGIDSLVITGTVTNVCCESSARDASMLNFRTIMVSDGNAALTQAEHEASLTAFYNIFGDVMDTDMLVAALERGRAAEAA
jgi:ureidoacrylate peracid hydrolase